MHISGFGLREIGLQASLKALLALSSPKSPGEQSPAPSEPFAPFARGRSSASWTRRPPARDFFLTGFGWEPGDGWRDVLRAVFFFEIWC